MSRLQAALSGKKSLVCFVTAGDPSISELPNIVSAIADAGADAVEIGLPFSDPIADGPTIQASSQRALDSGVTVAQVFEQVAAARGRTSIPIVLMTYYNPVLQIGLAEFARRALGAGVDGVIVTDLTPEEAGPWKQVSTGLDTVFLVAPTSTESRVRAVCSVCSGFVYCVSRTGVTGAPFSALDETKTMVTRVRSATNLPALVGFGITSPEDVRRVWEFADGAVVGSALVRRMHEATDAAGSAAALVRELR